MLNLLLIVISISLIVLMFSYLWLSDKVDKLTKENNRLVNEVKAHRKMIYILADDVYKENE